MLSAYLNRLIQPVRSSRTTLLLGLVVCGVGGSCLHPEKAYEEADREALGLIEDLRADLFEREGSFSIEPPSDSLRQRVLRGEMTELPPLTLRTAMEIAAENSRDFARRRERLYLAALDVTLERFQFSWIESAGANAAVNGTGGEGDSATGRAGGSLTRLLGNGAQIALDLGLNFVRLIGNGDGIDAFTDLGLSISQPLMRGAGELIQREPLTRAERNLVYEVRSYERFRRTFAVDVVDRVYDILLQTNILANTQLNVESLTNLRERNEALAQAGRLSDIQSDQARQNELRSENTVITAQQRLQNLEDDFKLFLGLPLTVRVEIDRGALAALADSEGELLGAGVDAELAEEEVLALALTRRLDYLTIVDQVEDDLRGISIAENALEASVGISAAAATTSPLNRPLALRANDVSWSAGLDLDLPLARLAERNALRRAHLSFVQSRRDAIEFSDTIHANLRDSLRAALTRKQSWDLQENAVAVAERRVDSALLYLEAGRADTRDLLEAQEALLDARNAATTALIDYALAKLRLLRDMELLDVDETGLHLASGWSVEESLAQLAEVDLRGLDPSIPGVIDRPEGDLAAWPLDRARETSAQLNEKRLFERPGTTAAAADSEEDLPREAAEDSAERSTEASRQ